MIEPEGCSAALADGTLCGPAADTIYLVTTSESTNE